MRTGLRPLRWLLVLLLTVSADTRTALKPALYSKACMICLPRPSASLVAVLGGSAHHRCDHSAASPCNLGLPGSCVEHPFVLYNESKRRIEHKRSSGEQTEEKRDDPELAAVPWQTLWLLQSSERQCDYQEAFLRFSNFAKGLQATDWLRNRPEEPIGHCAVRFRPHVDPHRWLPRNLVASECLCEGSPCARHGLHVCVTVFAVRSVYSLYTGKKRILIAVGCLCAIQKTRLAKVFNPQTVPNRR